MNWELKFMEWGDQWWASSIVDKVMPWFTHLGSVVAVILFIVFSSILSKSRKLFYRLLLLYGIQSAILYGLKYLVGRQRPVLMEISSRISAGPGEILDPSFPSGHTLYAFMMATLLAFWFPRYKIVFIIIACLIGWTRIYLGLHYPTDVIAGGILGYGVTRLILRHLDLSLTKK
jgi:undecaprenyl-diphosphatase